MGNFVRNFTEAFDFDGDKITVTMKQLKRVDAIRLIPVMNAMAGNKERDDMIAKTSEFVALAAEILQEGGYIVGLSGMKIGNVSVEPGSDLLKEVMEDFYFTGFVSMLANFLVKNSSMSKEVEKKSGNLLTAEKEVLTTEEEIMTQQLPDSL